MARVVVIGATGHVGGYLVPRLVRAGYDVVAVSRGEASPYRDVPAWRDVERRQLDRRHAGMILHGRRGPRRVTCTGSRRCRT